MFGSTRVAKHRSPLTPLRKRDRSPVPLLPLHPEREDYSEKETYDNKTNDDVKHYTLVASLHTFVHESHGHTSKTVL